MTSHIALSKRYKDLVYQLLDQPEASTLRARHEIQRAIGLRLITVQLAKIAYYDTISNCVKHSSSNYTGKIPNGIKDDQESGELGEFSCMKSDSHIKREMHIIEEDNINEPTTNDIPVLNIVGEGIISYESDRKLNSIEITKHHQRMFALLQIYCNEILASRNLKTLTLYRLTPMMLIDEQRIERTENLLSTNQTATYKQKDNESQSDSSELSSHLESPNVSNDIKSHCNASIIENYPIDTKKKKKKTNKKKKKNSQLHKQLIESVESSDIPEAVESGLLSHISLPHRSSWEETKPSSKIHDIINTNCKSLSRTSLSKLITKYDQPLDTEINRELIEDIIEEYEDRINKIQEHHEDKVQALYMRLFITENSFEIERETLLKKINNTC